MEKQQREPQLNDDLVIIDYILDRTVDFLGERQIFSRGDIERLIDEFLDVRSLIGEINEGN